jgi:nucleoside-diphosphate-sugar epimerase
MSASTLVTTSPICVTGGSGFLASWVVKMLLEKGFTVHATTRKREKALFLKELEGSEHLKIFDGCDFSVPNSFDKAIEGCYAVIHCASPFFNAGATRENLVVPAVEGTEMVLNACKKYKIQRVTLTASSACVIVDYGTKAEASETGNYVYTAADFSPADILEEKKNYYSLSKLYAEQRAWELSKEEGCPYKLCVLNPSLIWGPMTKGQTHLNTSSAAIAQYMDGTHAMIQNGVRCVVDVRDVAEAHITPIEKDIGWGKRYLLFGGAPHFKETAKYVKTALESNGSDIAKALAAKVPTEVEEKLQPTAMGPSADKPLLFDNSPTTKELGINFRSVEDMVTTCVHELLANGFTGSDQYDTKKL